MNIRHSIAVLGFCLFALQACRNPSYIVKPEASYEQLAPRKAYTDGNGRVHFIAYGKGSTTEECRRNAAYHLLQHILYNGIANGTEMKPLVGSGTTANEFRESESVFINQLINSGRIIVIKEKEKDKIATSVLKSEAMYQMSFEIAVHPILLKEEFNRIKNQNPS